MDTLPKIAIIVPCYNEGDRIDVHQFLDFAQNNYNVTFLFVNDGSADNTGEVIQDLNNKNPDQFLIKTLSVNCGKAEAVRQGFIEAFTKGYDYIGFFDADLATPLSAINSLCQILKSQNVSIVIGSRVRLLGRKIERKFLRHYIGRIFATFISIILNIPIYDSQCGAKMFKNDSNLKKVFSLPFRVKWIFDVEILCRYKLMTSNNLESHIVEYPLEIWKDIKGSKLKFTDFLKAPLEIIIILVLINTNKYSRYFKSI